MRPSVSSTSRQGYTLAFGFTLLEVMAAVVVLSILATLCFPLLGHLRSRFESIKCKANLSGLGLGMNSYIADHKVWPQISAEKKQEGQDSSPVSSEAQSQAEKWIAVLAPYGISECHTSSEIP